MEYKVEGERQFVMECPAYQEVRANCQELFDGCEGDIRKLICHPKHCILAELVHKVRVIRDKDTEWLFDLQLDRFESSDDESCCDVFSSDYVEYDLVELDLKFGFLETP